MDCTTTTNRCSPTTESPGRAEVRPEDPPSLAFPPPLAGDVRFFGARGAPRTPENRSLDPRSPNWDHPTNEMTAPSFKLRANDPEGRKAISYQSNRALGRLDRLRRQSTFAE